MKGARMPPPALDWGDPQPVAMATVTTTHTPTTEAFIMRGQLNKLSRAFHAYLMIRRAAGRGVPAFSVVVVPTDAFE